MLPNVTFLGAYTCLEMNNQMREIDFFVLGKRLEKVWEKLRLRCY